ncbi:hypothetical protein [Nitrososphaera sp.]|uniref:hypothetical protein n=1 Tax=Nitrososphaera sp. TaxID=1971748 RepID=UPI00307D4BD9
MANDNRGLASADRETRERVARKGGEARARNPQSLAEAGRKGGEAVVEKYGPEHMAEIGRKGGESSHGVGRGSRGGSSKDYRSSASPSPAAGSSDVAAQEGSPAERGGSSTSSRSD